jgi:conjugal transfer pilus assembly protein TraE
MMRLTEAYNRVLRQSNRLMIACATLGVVLVLLGISNLVLIGKERVVVLPAEVNRSFWIASDSVSESYLEQMAQFLVPLLLNISPSTAAFNSEQFLAQVAPRYFSAIKIQLVAQQIELERLGMSTSFEARHFKINSKKLRVEVEGALHTTLGNSLMPPENKVYRLQFVREQGRLWIRSFEELTDVPY